MGEAKRRRQKLGDQYGQVPSVLKPGSQQLEQQIEKFMLSWYIYMEEVNSEFQSTDDETADKDQSEILKDMKLFEDKIQEWLTNYFQFYRAQDRQTLLTGVLDPQYARIHEISKSVNPNPTDENIDQLQEWIMETLHIFNMFKPHLSKLQVQRYGEPLKSFYDMALKEAQVDNDDQQIEDLNLLFAPCLDL